MIIRFVTQREKHQGLRPSQPSRGSTNAELWQGRYKDDSNASLCTEPHKFVGENLCRLPREVAQFSEQGFKASRIEWGAVNRACLQFTAAKPRRDRAEVAFKRW